MATTTTVIRNEVDEYILSAPEDIRGRFEFFDGGWHEKPRGMSGWRHNQVSAYLVMECLRRGLQASFDVITHLPIGEERHPDVLVVGPNNPNQPGDGEYTGVPDLVMELLSAGNAGAYDERKRESYRLAGVRHYWLVRLGDDTVTPAVLVRGPDGDEQYVFGAPFPLFPLEALPLPTDL
jgi:Uma2 family endonuclease